MAQTSGFDPMTQVKTCFDCKMYDVANWVAASTEKMVPEGCLHIEALSVSPQGALEISSVVEQPPSLDRNHFSTPGVWQNPRNVMKGADLHPKDHRCLKQRLGRSLRANLYKGSVVRQGKNYA